MLGVGSPISGNILIVDDTPSNIRILADVLVERGHEVRPATTGQMALVTVQKQKPDLVLLDIRMPDMDGYEVCRKLKAQPETEDIPIIFLSVASDVEDKVRAFQAGGVDYITKPIQPEEVIVRVETHLKLHAMEKALRKSERQMRLIADNTPACISYVGTDDLRYRFVNRRHEETAGMSRDEILGKHIRDVIGESNYQFALKYIEEVKAGKPASYVNEFDLEEGKRWIQVNYVPDFDEDGQVRAVVVSSYDITEMKQAEDALRKSEHQMRLIADNSPAYIAYVGSDDLRYHFVNQKFETGFGIPREEIVGMHIREVIGESNYQFALKYIEEVKSGVPASYVNFFNLEQGKRWVQVNYVPDFDEHGAVKGIVVFSYDVTETKSAEERLRDSERRLSEIINFLPDPTFAIDVEGRVIIWNKAIEQMTGINADDMLGKCDYEYALPFYGHRRPIVIDLVTNYDEQIASQYDTIRRDGNRMISEVHIQNFGDRGAIWLENVAAPLYDEQGTVVGAIQAIRDITELKEAEKKLRESEEFYRLLVENLGEAIFVVDQQGTVRFANSNTIHLSGFTIEQLQGKAIKDFISQEDQDFVFQKIRDRLAGDQTPYSYQFRMVDRYNNVKWVHVNSAGIVWEGAPAGLVCASDISEIKKAEEALRESEAQYKTLYKEAKATEELYNSLLNSTLDAIVTYDPEGRVTYVNEGFTRLFGWVKEELTQGVPYTPESEREVTMRNVMRVIRDGEPLKDFETKRLTKDGSPVDVSISASRFSDHEGKPAGMLVILRDIGERKRAEKELAEALNAAEKLRDEAQAASKAKSEFVANMSHEIRTPMNAIMGMTDLALRNDMAPKLHDYLTKIHTSSQSLLRIINDILDFSKIEAGRLDIEHVRFDLRHVMRNMSDVVSASEECRDIEFLTAIDTDVPCRLIGDPLRLEQVLTNLANNAVKFTPKGEVLVRVETTGATGDKVHLLFTVRDTGIGISDDKLGALFKPFTQADGSTTRQFGGSGLGLTICKRLIDMMGGEIHVESEPGKGSLFSFQLVLDLQSDSEEQPFPTPADMQGMRVLVVDDNATSQKILLEILKSFSFEASAVDSGKQALEELIAAQHEKAYGLVLLDWRMPGIDGIQTARRIDREERLSGRIPKIIMITAFGTEEVKRQAEGAGLDAFLTKPVQPSLLLDTIMDVFGKEGPRVSEAAQARARHAMGADRIRGARILIAEDNEINQQVAREILEYAGASVQIAWNGKQALDALKKSEFDAVLMDIQMPEMDGYEATRLIRSDKRLTGLPVIAMTAHAMAGDRERALKAGLDDHIPKPVNAEVLLGTLARWVDISGREPLSDDSSREASTLENESELPDSIPGIHLRSALNRLQGNTTLLRKLLRDFAKNHGDSGNRLESAIKSRDYTSARQVAHAVKGVAGALSMNTLRDAASQAEKASLEGNHGECERSLIAFQHALARVCESIAHSTELTEYTQPDRPGRAGRSGAVDLAAVSGIVKELTRLAKLNHLDSITYLASVKEDLSTLSLDDDVRELEEAVEDTDFEKALQILNRFAETLGFTIQD